MPRGDFVQFSRPPAFPGLELATARYERRSFPRHVHDEYVVGGMVLGTETLTIRGASQLVAVGDLILIEPGVAHSNGAAGATPFGYRVMYIPVPLMMRSLSDLSGNGGTSLPRFREVRAHHPALCRTLVQLHRLLAETRDPLEQESGFLSFLAGLFQAQGVAFTRQAARGEHRKIAMVRDYIEAHFREKLTLGTLSGIAGLSGSHLLRSFKKQLGLPPAAYQTQLRIAEAKRLLRSDMNISEAAVAVGFVDQSHLSRHFQRIVGTTPGRYLQQ